MVTATETRPDIEERSGTTTLDIPDEVNVEPSKTDSDNIQDLFSSEILTLGTTDVDKKVIIGGYASVEMVDRENHYIPTDVLLNSFTKFMKDERYRNVNFAHSNVQVGVVLKEWTSPISGKTYKSGVDDRGLFIVAELRTDHTVADYVSQKVETGDLSGFSISGMAKQLSEESGGTVYKKVDDLELYEITVCAMPVNPGARFAILKSGVQLESFLDTFNKEISLGWDVSVASPRKISLPYNYTDSVLKSAIRKKVGSRPSLYGEYALSLVPYTKSSRGLRLGDVAVSITGEVATKGYDAEKCQLIIHAKEGSPLGSIIRRALRKTQTDDWRKLTEMSFDIKKKSGSGDIPLYYLVALKRR